MSSLTAEIEKKKRKEKKERKNKTEKSLHESHRLPSPVFMFFFFLQIQMCYLKCAVAVIALFIEESAKTARRKFGRSPRAINMQHKYIRECTV